MNIVESFLTRNIYYKRAEPITPRKLMLHSVGVDQPSAAVFLKNWNDEEYTRACVHAFIDANNGTVYQTMPWEWRAPHAGGEWLNDNSIGVEMCESSYIEYIGTSDRFEIINRAAALAHAKVTYMNAVELFAYLCLQYNLNPYEDILSHNEGGKQGIASKHSDPEHYWDQLGTGYTMDGFRRDVAGTMANGEITVSIIAKTEEEEDMFPVLKKGDKGDKVKALQKMLEATGFPCGSAGIDGDFGNGTDKAVKSFQTEYGLVPDGVVGANTWPVLVSAPNKAGDDTLQTELMAVQASAEMLCTRVEDAVKIFRNGKE